MTVATAVVLALGASAGVAGEACAQETAHQEIREEVHEARETHWGHPRLRLGFSGVGGGFVGAFQGAGGGLAVRVGVQLNDVVGIYLQGHGLITEFLPDPRPTSIIGFAFHELMLDITLLEIFQFGAGPSIDFIWGCTNDNGGAMCGRGGAFFGGDFRIAFAFGGHGPGRREGIVFSIDAHPTWVDHDFATMMLFGIGGELY
jgi:hypothetical protein